MKTLILFFVLLTASFSYANEKFDKNLEALKSEKFVVRETARLELTQMGLSILDLVEEELGKTEDSEVRMSLAFVEKSIKSESEKRLPLKERFDLILSRSKLWKKSELEFDITLPLPLEIDLTGLDINDLKIKEAAIETFIENLNFEHSNEWWFLMKDVSNVPRPIVLIYSDPFTFGVTTTEERWEFTPK